MKFYPSTRIALVVLLAVAVLTLSACTQPEPTPTPVPTKAATLAPTAAPTDASTAAAQATAGPTLPPAPKVGDVAPDFTLQAVDGKTVTLSSLKGKPVMLVFFATWCPHCKVESELLVKHYDEIVAQGFTLIGVSLGEKQETVAAYQQEMKIPWPLLLDADGEVARKYYVRSIPLSVFLDSELRIKSGYLGEIEESALLQEIGLGAK